MALFDNAQDSRAEIIDVKQVDEGEPVAVAVGHDLLVAPGLLEKGPEEPGAGTWRPVYRAAAQDGRRHATVLGEGGNQPLG
jgi:hypothetical protein